MFGFVLLFYAGYSQQAKQQTQTEDEAKTTSPQQISDEQWNSQPKKPVIGQTFRNRRVELDGYSYTNCTFENVTLVYRGEKPFDLAHNTFKNSVDVEASGTRLELFVQLLDHMDVFGPDIKKLDKH